MAGFKTPDFNERAAAARAARKSAVEQLRNKPAPDPEIVAARQAAHAAREERRAAKKAVADQAKADRVKAAEASPKPAPEPETPAAPEAPAPTEAELKAARDARYAARKARQR